MKNELKIFEDKNIRSLWDEEKEEWYFSIVDIVGVLSESSNPTDYLKKLRKRDTELGSYIGTICPQIAMLTKTGVKRRTLAGNLKDIFRIIQSIPSPKAEPFKIWLAQVGQERIEETIDPELAMQRAIETYRKKGYSEDWIKQRLFSIDVRKELTKEWDTHGIKEKKEYAILTNILTKVWSGKSVKEYKKYKGLTKENLKDNMTTTEIILNMLAENATTNIIKTTNPDGLDENKIAAIQGGTIAKNTRKEIEEKTGKSIISSKNAKDFIKEEKLQHTRKQFIEE